MAYRFRDAVAAWIPVGSPWRVFLAMLLLYVGTSLGIWIVFRLVSRLINRLKLKGFDRQIGALLGLAKGVVLCVIITLFAVTLLGEKQRQAIVNSQSGYYIAVLLSRLHTVIPEEIHDVLRPYLEVFDRRARKPVSEGWKQGGGGLERTSLSAAGNAGAVRVTVA